MKIDSFMENNVELAQYTTFKLGGRCTGLIHCQTPAELLHTIKTLSKEKTKFILIGGGSNLLVSDSGFDGYVVRYVTDQPLIKKSDNILKVSGSTILDDLVSYCAQNGYAGLNYASGIPGTVGGAVVGNAGAFGKQVGDVLVDASLLTLKGEEKIAVQSDLGFSYRYSLLKESRDIVSEVAFAIFPEDSEKLISERQEILQTRNKKHPDPQHNPCAGSFFRNIEPTSKAEKRQAAAYYLEQAGAFELREGSAVVFDRHANMIINQNQKATAGEVFKLSNQMKKIVKDQFNLDLIREVQLVGDFEGKPNSITSDIW